MLWLEQHHAEAVVCFTRVEPNSCVGEGVDLGVRKVTKFEAEFEPCMMNESAQIPVAHRHLPACSC